MEFDVAGVVGEKSERVKLATVLLTMLGVCDRAAWERTQAVACWSRRLCTTMQVPAESAAFLVLCAALRDVGMVSVPLSVVRKASLLNRVELDLMREHPAAGERIVGGIPELAACGIVIRSHHERFGGGGYPDGIAGLEIPFEARVIAVADAFHAMVSERPYRPSIAPRAALDMLARGRGAQWDPLVVDAMVELLRASGPAERPAGLALSS